MRTHRTASWASAHRASTVQSAASRKLSPASVIGGSSTMKIRGREPPLRPAAPSATKARSPERRSMRKVGSSLVDIPMTVTREGVCIMTRFPESDDGPDPTTTAPLEDFVLSVTSADEMPALKCSEDQVLKLLRPKTDRQETDGRVSVTRPPDPDCDSRGLRPASR